jgi:hypothetical protein
MTACIFVHICLHVAYTNKNLGNEQVPSLRTQFHEDLPYARVCTLQDGVSNDLETFSYLMKTYESACANTKASQIARQKRFFGNNRPTPQLDWTAVSSTPMHMADLGVLVCALGSD